MTLTELGALSLVYFSGITFVGILIAKEFYRYRFNFNILFSVLYLLAFYFGFPLTMTLIFQYEDKSSSAIDLFYTLVTATLFYGFYYLTYKIKFFTSASRLHRTPLIKISRVEMKLICAMLFFVALLAMGLFYNANGLLLFKLRTYSQIFSGLVSGVALKRFFYFYMPALLILYFVKPNRKNWLLFLVFSLSFGLLTYLLAGGTRANIILALGLFLFIGITHRYIQLWMLFVAGVLGIIAMFALALRRYNLDVSGSHAFYTFLYLTRDTFSPWEAVGKLFGAYDNIQYQGVAPIIRDFYVFIPQWLWPDRPNLILNTANYFTWEVLHYHNGLAISPTLIGSLMIMGGVIAIPLGALTVGFIVKWFDWLYQSAKQNKHIYSGAVIQGYCFANIFNMIVLVREGLDAFCSRFIFFSVIFALCILLAKLIYWILFSAKLIHYRHKVQGMN